jgi:hypothetical protein
MRLSLAWGCQEEEAEARMADWSAGRVSRWLWYQDHELTAERFERAVARMTAGIMLGATRRKQNPEDYLPDDVRPPRRLPSQAELNAKIAAFARTHPPKPKA